MTQSQALSILKTGANVFLTGEPGSGKTHTVNQYVRWLRNHAIEPAITASTGIAATHINGATIHSWSGIGIKRALTAPELTRIANNKRVAKKVKEARVLIVDEISMLPAATLGMIEEVCRRIRGGDLPFGGLQVVLVGDFFQLPPIRSREDNETSQLTLDIAKQDDSPFAFGSWAWKNLSPVVCYLSEQHRQEDATFLEMLSSLRRGAITATHHALLKTRTGSGNNGVTQLFSHNVDVDRINTIELTKLSTAAREFKMTSYGPSELIDLLAKGCLSPEVLSLKIGARVMFTKNDVTQRFVNGTLGEIVGFSPDNNYPVVKTYAGRTVTVEPVHWSYEDGGEVQAYITQIPLRLAWAMTVHKSQGMSLDAAHMDLTSVFEYGQGYVALSRVRTLSGLSLIGINRRALEVHPDIQKKDVEFREASADVQAKFDGLSAEELEQMHNEFIRRCKGAITGVIKKPANRSYLPDDPNKAYSVATLRQTHTNAYRPWSEDEEANLLQRHHQGESVKSIAESLGRKVGAIRSRLKKLGL